MSVNLASPGGAEFERAYEGQILDLANAIIGSRVNESATPIEYGRAIAQGANGGCKPVDNANNIICGISCANPITGPADYGTHAVNFKQYQDVPIAEIASVAVKPVENWNDGDALYAIVSQGGKLGTARGGGASSDRLLVPGVRMKGAGLANTIGEARVLGGQGITLSS